MKKILLIILTLSTQVSADTIVNSGYYDNKIVNWTKAGSPYVINGPLNFSSSTLNISDAKVIIKSGSIGLYDNSIINMRDVLIENDTSKYSLNSFDSKVFLNTATLKVNQFIEAYDSNVIIDDLTSLSLGYENFISIYNSSNLSLTNSHIQNYKGVVLNIFEANNLNVKDTEFINNKNVLTLYKSGSTTFAYNDFERNTVAVESYAENGNFEDNYFEKENPLIYPYKEDAPSAEKNIIAGPFSITRFSKNKNIKKTEICCSNVMFLPGVMGSRLYMSGSTENQLWEPNRNTDVKKLFLDSVGQSINSIFTKDIIVKTNFLGGLPHVDKDIYKDFVAYLNTVKKQNVITDYSAVPYDWRMSADYILDQGIVLKDKNVDLIQVMKDLQKTSKTGKVTIITHSNGGLVAKQLVLELQRLGLEGLVDKIIFVAMPEYGTAQAITALILGHNQSLAGGLIMRSSIARELAKNMPTAYMLLPSEKYYVFSPNSDKLLQETFIRNHSRLNPGLLAKSKELHEKLDNLVYPENIKIYQILGTGVNTMSDIKLDDKNIFKIIPLYEKNGDGVVQDLYSSRHGIVMSVDLNNTSYKHVNIMNSEKVLAYINTILNPPRSDYPLVGLDYNKIIKNNNYKLLRITPSNPNNKLSEFLTPLDMELSIGISKLKDNIDNELYFDKFSANTNNDFRVALEHLNNNRFEEFDDSVNYLYTTDIKNFSIKPTSDNTIDINILESMDTEIVTTEYKNISIFKNSEMSFSPSVDFNSLDITLPTTGQIMALENEKLKVQLSLNEKIDKIIADIKVSKIETYLKGRYIRRIEVYRQNKDIKYLDTVKKRVTDAIHSMNKISYSSSLRTRYAKSKEDYIYLNFLLLKL